MPPQQQNQYDFIMNGSPKPPRNPLLGTGLGARIAVIAGLLIIIIIIGAVINSFLTKGDRVQTDRLVEIAQTQTEIIRVSSLAKDKAKDINTLNLAVSTRLSVESSHQEVKASLAARGVKGKSLNKKLAASKNPKTDAALDEATKNSRFDETFLTIINKQLTDYQKLLQAAYPGSKTKERSVLTASYENAGRLVKKSETGTTSQ